MSNSYKRINRAATGGGNGAASYSLSFNSTNSWSGPTDNEYSITITEAVHGVGNNIIAQVFELVSGEYELVTVQSLIVATNGNVTISVPSSPDTRFAGKIVIS